MTALAEVNAELDRAAGLIGAAREVVDGGKLVDLTGLDDLVKEACARIEALPDAERAAVKPVLVSLIDALNGLVAALGTQQGEVAGQIEGVSSRSRAAAAYGKGAAVRGVHKGPDGR